LALLAVIFVGSPDLRSQSPASAGRRRAMLAAEDARAPDDGALKVLLDGTRASAAPIRLQAVRALGRLERPALLSAIAPLLEDGDAGVRAEAANAVAQAAQGLNAAGAAATASSTLFFDALSRRLALEREAVVRSRLCESVGRLPYTEASQVRAVERLLLDVLGAAYGVAKGLEALVRRGITLSPPSPEAIARLRMLAQPPSQSSAEPSRRAARLALLALNTAGAWDDRTALAGLNADDVQARRLTVIGGAALPKDADEARRTLAERVIRRGLDDGSEVVRYDALRLYRRVFPEGDCRPVLEAVADRGPHVALLAIDLLATPCSDPAAVATLGREAEAIRAPRGAIRWDRPATAPAWHRAAHALVSLAAVAPEEARGLLPAFVESPVWQVRMYAARAARTLKDTAALHRLFEDARDNVREEALGGLIQLRQHEADAQCIAALAADDYQLVMTAARGLARTPGRERAVPALVAALDRLTLQQRENTRDARLAILNRLVELGSPSQATAMRRYLTDVDPRIAAAAADLLRRWTGAEASVSPRPLPIAPADLAEIERLSRATARITMKGVGTFEIRLRADVAPMSVLRFARLARAGFYGGLTFHRIVPNFVIQGGSPGANEYVGDGPFMRDELGLPHLRGTLGISTRGRDTGDAQIYVNYLDNPRLDHDYTVFAEITTGMEIVDLLLEGDVIERIEIVVKS
jgi:cyclophilin family peptidyl-prolyl cis-trans isomerase/HEAT repeat protein